MTEPARLNSSAIALLREAYNRFMGAKLGELNTSAEEFTKVCKQLGWTPSAGAWHPLPWARKMLEIEP